MVTYPVRPEVIKDLVQLREFSFGSDSSFGIRERVHENLSVRLWSANQRTTEAEEVADS
jgi:hypothetical protein